MVGVESFGWYHSCSSMGFRIGTMLSKYAGYPGFHFCEDGLREVWSRGLNHSGGGGGGGIKGLLIEFVVHIIVCRPGETVLLT